MSGSAEPDPAASAGPPLPGGGSAGSAFDDYGSLYATFAAVMDRVTGNRVSTWLDGQLPGGTRLLDLGVGGGRHLPIYTPRYPHVVGVDASPRMVMSAAAVPTSGGHVELHAADLLGLGPAKLGAFDAVVSLFTLHHAGDPDRVLPHVRSLVSPGGTAVLVDMVDPGEWASRAWHVDRAARTATWAFDAGATNTEAAAVLRLLLHPRWLEQCARDVPLTRPEFHRRYSEVFPGCRFVDDLHPAGHMCAAVWTDPAG